MLLKDIESSNLFDVGICNKLNEIVSPYIGEDKVFPVFGASETFPFITYTITPITGGHIKQSQLEVKAISDDQYEALQLLSLIDKVFDMEEDNKSLVIDNIHAISSHSGGGELFNDSIQVWEIYHIYILKWRYINNG